MSNNQIENLLAAITLHMEAWAAGSPPYRRMAAGFVAFTYDMREETLAALTDEQDSQLASDLAYSVRQDEEYRELDAAALETACVAWLSENRRVLVRALRESLASD